MAQSRVTLVGAGTIGLSFAALYLVRAPGLEKLTIYDPRPDLSDYIAQNLPHYISSVPALSSEAAKSSDELSLSSLFQTGRLSLAADLSTAVKDADVIHEQGPENPDFKQSTWAAIEQAASKTALFWTSTSGIPASVQQIHLVDKTRLIVVHPFNPPHLMPLIEIVPSPTTTPTLLDTTTAYWKAMGRTPVVCHKEVTGFAVNRLAYALLREAVWLVREGVLSVDEVDELVENSMGPRWSVAGPFRSYHVGGGVGGFEAFMDKIGGTVQRCWDDADESRKVVVGEADFAETFQQAREVYGGLGQEEIERRDTLTAGILKVLGKMGE